MRLETYTTLTSDLTKEFEEFLYKANSKFNPLFSSPIWAKRLKVLIFFDFRFLIVRDNKEIVALHLIFEGYRGYSRISKFPLYLKFILQKVLFIFYGYQISYNFIVFKKDLDLPKINKSKKLIYKNVQTYGKRIVHFPIFDNDIKYFNSQKLNIIKWGTYTLNFSEKSYEKIFASYNRSAKKPINTARSIGVYVKKLKDSDLQGYAVWLKFNQAVTGKNYPVSEKAIKKDLDLMKKRGYINEIFVAYLDNKILGSLGIWGFRNFISEHGVNISSYAKKNKIYVQELIKDEIIKYCFKNDIQYYDLSGFNPNKNASDKEKSIKFFKEKFNGVKMIYDQII